MAKLVGYFDDNVTFDEGPFVLTNPLNNGYRVEVQIKESGTPVLPAVCIYEFLELNGFDPCKSRDIEKAKAKVDFLNHNVSDGVIKKSDKGIWKVEVKKND